MDARGAICIRTWPYRSRTLFSNALRFLHPSQSLIPSAFAKGRARISTASPRPKERCPSGFCWISGGNDSTVLAHLFRPEATHAAHANTTIGIAQTRDFVRSTCEEWGLPLIERTPPRESDHYRALVLDQGFPGPGHHFKMFQRLKERALRSIQKDLGGNPRTRRVVFLAGRRRSESQRRANVPAMERRSLAARQS